MSMGDSQDQLVAGIGTARQAAVEYGIDIHLLDYLQTLTPAERFVRHEQALELVQALRKSVVLPECRHPSKS